MEISQDKYFYTKDGSVLKNKRELLEFLRRTDEKTIHHHFNMEKNDFANWTQYVLQEEKLAKRMFKATTKEAIIEAIEESFIQQDNQKKDKKTVISRLIGAIKHG